MTIFTIHERMLSVLLLELQHRKIAVSDMQRNDAIEKIVTVVLETEISQRKQNSIQRIITLRKALEKSERFLNLTSPTYKNRP